MENVIITNNKLVLEKYKNVIFIEGDYLDVLNYVRDKCYINYSLVNHPLFASIRMFFSPVRSIILKEGFNENSAITIDESIDKYKKILGIRKPDFRNQEDYELIDLNLLDGAIFEKRS